MFFFLHVLFFFQLGGLGLLTRRQIHFPFAGVEGIALGERVAVATLEKFDANWDKF